MLQTREKTLRIHHNATRTICANNCTMRYYLIWIEREKPLRLSAYVKGDLLHELIENFRKNLGTEEELEKDRKSKKKAKEKKQYFDAESFVGYAQRKWRAVTNGAKRSKKPERKIYWKNEDETEQYKIENTLPKICRPLFKYLIKEGEEEGPPLYSELRFDFVLDGLILDGVKLGRMRINGRIDEVRKRNGKIVIRDYKSGYPWIKAMRLKFDPQLTYYNLGLCSLCYENEEFAKTLGLEKERKKFMGNEFFINPDFDIEYFMIEALPEIEKAREDPKITPPPLIRQTRRSDKHFYELIKMNKGIEKKLQEGIIYPERGDKCDYCDARIVCESRFEKETSVPIDKRGNILFSFAIPPYKRIVEVQSIQVSYKHLETLENSEQDSQKRFNWRKKDPRK